MGTVTAVTLGVQRGKFPWLDHDVWLCRNERPARLVTLIHEGNHSARTGAPASLENRPRSAEDT
jgi:hypothetical protein